MDKPAPDDPILARLKRELVALYGPRLKQVLLYGSRARGDHRDDSDYDVLVVLEGELDWWAEMDQLARLSTRIGIETAGKAILSLKSVTPDDLQKRTGFMHNVRNEAIAI
jgi:predicted nucleotidyltransferase